MLSMVNGTIRFSQKDRLIDQVIFARLLTLFPGLHENVRLPSSGVLRGIAAMWKLKDILVYALIGGWFLVSLFAFSDIPGDDLSSLYFAARFIESGRIEHVFSYDPVYFHIVGDPVWTEEAKKAGFEHFLHPFVQAPLWAWVVSPLAVALDFPTFNHLFLFVNVFGAVGTFVLAIWMWDRRLLAPIPLAMLILLISASQPFRYTFYLNQTQAIILFLTVAAVYAERRSRPVLAGLALAVASLIKILPLALAVYWFAVGCRRAALWTVGFLAGAAVLGLVVLDPRLNLTYLHRLREISNIVVLGMNNQSFVTWLTAMTTPIELKWQMAPLPAWLKLLNYSVAAVVFLAFAWRWRVARPVDVHAAAIAVILLVTTIFAPIAWTHYYLVLVVISVVLLRLYSSRTGVLLIALIWVLNTRPIAPAVMPTWRDPFLWTHFYSGLLALAGLYFAPRRH
jgi:Glycosyltransferase family 87